MSDDNTAETSDDGETDAESSADGEPEENTRPLVAVTGASGLIGTHLCSYLRQEGWEVLRVVRSEPTGSDEILWKPSEDEIEAESFEGLDAVVHLAGENIFGRWTDEKKKRIMDSRAQGTKLVARTLAEREDPPDVFVSMSAVGYYGDTGDREVDESDPHGEGFLAEVTRAWESATEPAEEAGIRTVRLRCGIVLSTEGGALGMMMTPFKFGLGGRIGSGDQYMAWIAMDDLVRVVDHTLESDIDGPVNAVAPDQVTNSEFTETLGDVLGRPTFLPVPSFAAKLTMGEMAEEMLLSGQRVRPQALEEADFDWHFPTLEDALEHEID